MTDNLNPDHIINPNSDGTKPVFRKLNSTKKVRKDDKRGPNHDHPISKPKTAEEKKAFIEKQFRPKWAKHPLKQEVLKWFEDGYSAYKVVDKLEARAVMDGVPREEYSLSLPTLIKIRRRHLRAIGALRKEDVQSRLATMAEKNQTEAERVLWATVRSCTEKKKDSTISPKDWQYYDQQQQSALQLLNQLKSEGKSGEDIAVVISRVFAQFFKQHNANPSRAQAPPSGTDNDSGPQEGDPV